MQKLHNLWRNFTNSEEKKALWENFFSLSTIQAFGYVLPLLTVPYVVRVVGTQNYGSAAFALAVGMFFAVVVDYGFNLTATREASIHRDDMGYLSRLYAAVMSVKIILVAAGLLLILVLGYGFPQFGGGLKMMLAAYTVVVGNALFPAWLFQGLERMRAFTLFSVLPRIVAAGAVFVLIKSPADTFWIPALQGLGGIIAGLAGIAVAYRVLGLRFVKPELPLVKAQFRKGFPVFVANFANNVYINTSIMVLGVTSSAEAVGFYAVAEKIITSVRGILVVLFHSIYPRACLRAAAGKSLFNFYRKIISMGLLVFGSIGLLLFFAAPQVIWVVSGEYGAESALVLKIMALVPVIVLLNIPPYQMLLIAQKNRAISVLLLGGAVFNTGLNVVLSNIWAEVGTAVTVLWAETFIAVGYYFLYSGKNILSIFQHKQTRME